jgi:hypothetical protein
MNENDPVDSSGDAVSVPAAQAFAAHAPAAAPPMSYPALLLRLWTLRSPGAVSLHHSGPVLVCLTMAWLLLWIAIDRWDAGPDSKFFLDNTPLFAWYALALLGLAALLRWRSKPTPAFGAALALSIGLVPVPLLLEAVAPSYLNLSWLLGASLVAILYSLLYLARGLRALTGSPQRLTAALGIGFVLGFVWLTDALDVVPQVWADSDPQTVQSDASPAVDVEALLFAQQGRIDRALQAIKVDASNHPKAFFLGFAGVGDDKVFAQEIGLASRVLGERFAIDGRGLSLINDERDLDSAPLASAAGLKFALRGLGARMNRERDVLFLSISSHGAQDPSIAVSNAQLPLNDLTEDDLSRALDESGIKWRVIIISACYAGAFIDSLKNPQTVVIAAAAADRTSFGCSNDRDLTYFGEAFYRDALPEARSLRDAFEKAKAAVDARERREQITASKPQAFFGAELEAKLASMSDSTP